MPSRRHVALLLDTSTSWGSGLVRGVLAYARSHTDWIVYFEPRGKYEVLTPPRQWNGQGIIARVTTSELAEYIAALGLAAVNVSWYRHEGSKARIAHCTTDVQQAGSLCARHLLERGFRHFAYCGAVHRPHYEDELLKSYQATLKEAGYGCSLFRSQAVWHRTAWQIEYDDLLQWLQPLPKPLGLLAFDAVRGRQITEVCRGEGLAVPENVAVLAGEHDTLYAEESTPPLSTLDIAPWQVGYRAAALLAEIMQSGTVPAHPVWVPPGRITTRQSTDTLAVDDPDVAAAMRFIHEHANEPIQVKDVVRRMQFSRRVLEQKFKMLLGRSPAAEIRRRRIERVKDLLDDTELSLSTIAAQTGFRYVEVLTRAFQRETGMTPSAFRIRRLAAGEQRILRTEPPALSLQPPHLPSR